MLSDTYVFPMLTYSNDPTEVTHSALPNWMTVLAFNARTERDGDLLGLMAQAVKYMQKLVLTNTVCVFIITGFVRMVRRPEF
jgi:hypothetical protein